MTVTLTLTAADGATHQISLPAPTVAAPSVSAPAITNVRTVSTSNSLFNVANGGSTISNNLNLFGTSSYPNATVTVYLGGKSVGTTTTNSSGAWTYALGVMADATYAATATVTSGSTTSQQSAAYSFTIKPGLTSLPVAIGSNVSNGGHFNWGADDYEAQHDPANPNACVVVDSHTLHFIIGKSDSWPSYPTNRTEIQNDTQWANGQTFNCSYEFMLDPNFAPFDDGIAPVNQTCTIGQIHEDGSAKVPCLYAMDMGSGTQGDSPVWVYDQGGTYSWNASGLNNIGRGTWHTMDMVIKPTASGSSVMQITLDGHTYINTTTMKGSGIGSGYYLKLGIYRGQVSGHDSNNGMYYRNLVIAYT